MISAAENPNYQNFSSWNIDTVAIRKGSFEVIMETRDGKYVCIPCFEMWKEIMAFIKKKKKLHSVSVWPHEQHKQNEDWTIENH